MTGPTEPKRWGAELPLAIGYLGVLALVGGIGLWSVATNIAGAVVAPGTVKVESERQVVQHPDGGVVGSIQAHDGDQVEAGDILVRFDDTFLRSELGVVDAQLLETAAQKIRLQGERDGKGTLDFNQLPVFASLDAGWVENQIAGQQSLFSARRDSLQQQAKQLSEQQLQFESQIEGFSAQSDALAKQQALIGEELGDLQTLEEKGLVPVARVLRLQREAARLEGEIGSLAASMAQSRGMISENAIKILNLHDARREESITRLSELRFGEIELIERQISIQERLSRLDARAPVDGIVFGSRIFTVKSVVKAAEPMMFIVPKDQPLQVSARIDPIHIDQVHPGQIASLRFPTFDQRTTPEIPGRVLRISADIVVDEATGIPFYEAIIAPQDGVLDRHPDLTFLPGMPVETFLTTRDRTPMSYLTQPLANYFNRAFREN